MHIVGQFNPLQFGRCHRWWPGESSHGTGASSSSWSGRSPPHRMHDDGTSWTSCVSGCERQNRHRVLAHFQKRCRLACGHGVEISSFPCQSRCGELKAPVSCHSRYLHSVPYPFH